MEISSIYNFSVNGGLLYLQLLREWRSPLSTTSPRMEVSSIYNFSVNGGLLYLQLLREWRSTFTRISFWSYSSILREIIRKSDYWHSRLKAFVGGQDQFKTSKGHDSHAWCRGSDRSFIIDLLARKMWLRYSVEDRFAFSALILAGLDQGLAQKGIFFFYLKLLSR